MPTLAELLVHAAALPTEIAATRERAAPEEWIRRIAAAGLFTMRVPRSLGGPGGSMRDVIRFVVDVASIAPHIARTLRPGFGFVERLLFSRDDAARRHWLARVLAGEVPGLAGREAGAPAPLPALDQLLSAAVEAGRAKHALARAVRQDVAAIASNACAAEATLLHAAVAIESGGQAGLTQDLLAEVLEAVAQARFFAAAAMPAARPAVVRAWAPARRTPPRRSCAG